MAVYQSLSEALKMSIEESKTTNNKTKPTTKNNDTKPTNIQ